MKKLLAFILVITCILILSACNSNTPSQSNGTDPLQNNSEAEQPEESNLAIGETATLGDWEVSVTEFTFTTKLTVNDFLYFSPDEGNQYAVVSLSITNNAKEAANFLPSFSSSKDIRAKICYGDGYEYSASTLLGYDKDLHDSTLNPLTSKEGDIIFTVPDAVVNSEDALIFVLSAGNENITFDLR